MLAELTMWPLRFKQQINALKRHDTPEPVTRSRIIAGIGN
jgi:hypothetical protein